MICRVHGHRWDQREAKRTCSRCGREEWLFQRRFPRVGEPALSWQEMAFGNPPPDRRPMPEWKIAVVAIAVGLLLAALLIWWVNL
jgi:hypothetical protein